MQGVVLDIRHLVEIEFVKVLLDIECRLAHHEEIQNDSNNHSEGDT